MGGGGVVLRVERVTGLVQKALGGWVVPLLVGHAWVVAGNILGLPVAELGRDTSVVVVWKVDRWLASQHRLQKCSRARRVSG